MSICYRIDHTAGVVITEIEGAPALDEITNHLDFATADPEISNGYSSLIDLRKAAPMPLSVTDVYYVARLAREKAPSTFKLAFVASDEMNAGLCAIYQHYLDDAHPIQLFTDIDRAWTWLKNGAGTQ